MNLHTNYVIRLVMTCEECVTSEHTYQVSTYFASGSKNIGGGGRWYGDRWWGWGIGMSRRVTIMYGRDGIKALYPFSAVPVLIYVFVLVSMAE